MRRLLAPSTPVGLVWAWPLRLLPIAILGLLLLGWGLFSEPLNPWNDLVAFLVVALVVGLVTGRDARRTAGTAADASGAAT